MTRDKTSAPLRGVHTAPMSSERVGRVVCRDAERPCRWRAPSGYRPVRDVEEELARQRAETIAAGRPCTWLHAARCEEGRVAVRRPEGSPPWALVRRTPHPWECHAHSRAQAERKRRMPMFASRLRSVQVRHFGSWLYRATASQERCLGAWVFYCCG